MASKVSGIILRHSKPDRDMKVYSKKTLVQLYEQMKGRGFDVYLNKDGNLCANDIDRRTLDNELAVIDNLV